MPRSYFSRMVRGGGGAALIPPRPVSNLWKSARMEGAAVEAVPERLSPAPSLRARRVEVEPAIEPASASPVDTRIVTREVSEEVAPERPRSAVRENEAPYRRPRPDEALREETKPRAPSSTASVPVQPEVSAIKNRVDTAGPRWNTVPSRTNDAELPHELKPRGRSEEEPTHAERPSVDSEPSRQSAPAKKAAMETMEPAVFQPAARTAARIEEPARTRERAARNAATQEEARTTSKNSVQIGKIEVQVVTPAAPVRYAPAPAAPKGRLARGYSLWAAWH
jgi:hypothetical protein